MVNLLKEDIVEITKIINSIHGRIDENLIKLTIDLVFKTKVTANQEDHRLFSVNINKIPINSLEAFSLGSFFGQAYQVSLDIAKKLDLKLKGEQKRILREFIFFIVLMKFEKEMTKK